MATIVPKIRFVAGLLAQEVPLPEIWSAVQKGFEEGVFQSPRRPGVAYMLSNYNRPFNQREAGQDWRIPFVGYQGPHGYIIQRMQQQNTPSIDDLPMCPAWVRE